MGHVKWDWVLSAIVTDEQSDAVEWGIVNTTDAGTASPEAATILFCSQLGGLECFSRSQRYHGCRIVVGAACHSDGMDIGDAYDAAMKQD